MSRQKLGRNPFERQRKAASSSVQSMQTPADAPDASAEVKAEEHESSLADIPERKLLEFALIDLPAQTLLLGLKVTGLIGATLAARKKKII